MRILAIETSGRHGSLAVLVGQAEDVLLQRQVVLEGEPRPAQSLAPGLRDLLAGVNWQPASIGLVAVAVGPGSFTGLRIGVTTAKAFAYAVGAEIVGVNTLEVLASQVQQGPSPLWTIMDAQRQELFAAKFDLIGGSAIATTNPTQIIPQDAWLALLQLGDRVTGPAVRRLLPRLPSVVIAMPEDGWQPTAAAVGKVAWQRYRAGQRDDVWQLVPAYFRLSAAEEKRSRSGSP
jgi:tRNA threonylcarbamoyladenosine biosynthesis protein TsaB